MGYINLITQTISKFHFCHESCQEIFFNLLSSQLSQWLWSTFIQKELDNYLEFRNGTMQKDKTKAGPSGDSRNNLCFMPEKWGGKDWLQKVDIAVIRELKEMVSGESLLQFVMPEYASTIFGLYSKRCYVVYPPES